MLSYLVRLRFWRARGLLSTSGGRALAMVSCEWTRNANDVLGVREEACGEDDGDVEEAEPDMVEVCGKDRL